MARGIRSYGPGKFNTIIDSYAYELTLDGHVDEEASYPEGGGWFGFIEVDQAFADRIHEIAKEQKDELTDEEQDLLDESKAIILSENSDGLVAVTWFDDSKEAKEDWTAIEDELHGDDEDEEDDEDEDDAFSEDEMREGYVISDARGGVTVAHSGKHLGSYDDTDEALEAIAKHMKSSNFYPNIYYVNDHGNVDLLDGDGNVIESRV